MNPPKSAASQAAHWWKVH